MAIIISHSHVVDAAFASSLVCQTFDRMILGRLRFPGTRCFQGGTRWKYRVHKLFAIGKSLGTAALHDGSINKLTRFFSRVLLHTIYHWCDNFVLF